LNKNYIYWNIFYILLRPMTATEESSCWKVSNEGGTIAACPQGSPGECLPLMTGEFCPADKKVII
jgi:hypothetical protein